MARNPAGALRRVSALLRDGSAASSIVQNFVVRVAMIGVTFGTGIIVARTLAPLGRGEQAALGLWPMLLSGLATIGVPLAVNFQSRRRPEDAGKLFFAGTILALCSGLIACAVGIVAMPVFLHGYDPSLIGAARWLLLFVPQILVLYVIRANLEANGEFTRSIMGQFVPTCFTLLALVGLRLTGRLTPVTAAFVYFVPSFVWTVWVLRRLWPRMNVEVASLRQDLMGLLSYGCRSYGTDLINALSSQLDLAVIVAFLNPVALGLYSVALTLSRLLAIVQQSLGTVLFPQASSLDQQSAIELVGRGARLSTLLSIGLGLALLVVVPFALPLVYGNAFSAAISIMPMLTAEAVLSGLANILAVSFFATGRPAVVTFIQGGWLGCALLLLLICVPRMQLLGAAAALLGASVLRIAFVALAYRLVFRQGLPRLIVDAADITYLRNRLLRKRPQGDAAAGLIVKRA